MKKTKKRTFDSSRSCGRARGLEGPTHPSPRGLDHDQYSRTLATLVKCPILLLTFMSSRTSNDGNQILDRDKKKEKKTHFPVIDPTFVRFIDGEVYVT